MTRFCPLGAIPGQPIPRIKPLLISSGITNHFLGPAVLEGAREMLRLAGVDRGVPVFLSTKPKQGEVLVGRYLMPNGQVDADSLLVAIQDRRIDYYQVYLVQADLSNGRPEDEFVLGWSFPLTGSVISPHRLRTLNRQQRRECFKTVSMHELGHVFDLPLKTRDDLVHSVGAHCPNICIMRQGLNVPDDWLQITADRLAHGPLCEQCLADLRKFFL